MRTLMYKGMNRAFKFIQTCLSYSPPQGQQVAREDGWLVVVVVYAVPATKGITCERFTLKKKKYYKNQGTHLLAMNNFRVYLYVNRKYAFQARDYKDIPMFIQRIG